jgi:hypothetical protein
MAGAARAKRDAASVPRIAPRSTGSRLARPGGRPRLPCAHCRAVATRTVRASSPAPPPLGAATRGTSPVGDAPAARSYLGAAPRPSLLRGGRPVAGEVGR